MFIFLIHSAYFEPMATIPEPGMQSAPLFELCVRFVKKYFEPKHRPTMPPSNANKFSRHSGEPLTLAHPPPPTPCWLEPPFSKCHVI